LETRAEEVQMIRKLAGLGIATAVALGVIPTEVTAGMACPIALPEADQPVALDPADFMDGIDNPLFPLEPGSRWVYRELDPEGKVHEVTVTVTARTRDIAGISATVVHDKVSAQSEFVENTFDWYAQDVCGNVWYLGENTKEYEEGVVVSTEGSWEHGVGGAYAGVIMPANPQVGQAYREEYLAGEAQDQASVLSVEEQAQVPAGHFTDVVLTKGFTPLHRRVLEYKLYAPGVGVVLAMGISGGSDIERLISFEAPEA
jgi:hypothetical protein